MFVFVGAVASLPQKKIERWGATRKIFFFYKGIWYNSNHFQLLLFISPSVPIPDEGRKLIFIVTLLCGATKSFMKALRI